MTVGDGNGSNSDRDLPLDEDLANDTEFAGEDLAGSTGEAGGTEYLSDNERILGRDVDFSKLEGPGSSRRVAELQAECEKLKADSAENRDKYLRALADLENYKKRALKERSDLLKYQGREVLAEMVEVVDDLERAIAHIDSGAESGAVTSDVKVGLDLILKRFSESLNRFGVRSESGVGKPFDPNMQQALSKQPTNAHPPGTVTHELKKTYFFKDTVLRHGQVIVADAPTGGVN